jgi:ABC-type sugar transport system ATPase subunit
MNLFKVRRSGDWLELDGGGGRLPVPPGLAVPDGTKLIAGLRAHQLMAGDAGIPVTVALTEHLGRSNIVVCAPERGTEALVDQDAIQIETDASVQPEPGTSLDLTANPEAITIFDTDGQAIECDPPSAAS